MKSKRSSKIYQNIIILGSQGMLGKNVNYYFRDKFKVHLINKKITPRNLTSVIGLINRKKKSIIFNCIGAIPQKKIKDKDMFFSNYLITKKFSENLSKKHFLIHPSTDCVFDGNSKTSYKKNDQTNAKDFYGITKLLSEKVLENRNNTLIVRVSIIGKNTKTKKDLLTWFLHNKKKLNGYTNHFWNGITTLEWCKKIEYILKFKKKYNNSIKLIQLGTKEIYSKYEMLKIFQKIFEKKIIINRKKTQFINRTLKPDVYSPNLEIQLEEFKNLKYFKKL